MKTIQFTDRETEVLRLVSRGYQPPEIAAFMSLSVSRIAALKRQVKDKTNLRSDAGLTRYWIDNYEKQGEES